MHFEDGDEDNHATFPPEQPNSKSPNSALISLDDAIGKDIGELWIK